MFVAAPEVVNFKYTHTHMHVKKRGARPRTPMQRRISAQQDPMANTGLFVGYPVLAGKI